MIFSMNYEELTRDFDKKQQVLKEQLAMELKALEQRREFTRLAAVALKRRNDRITLWVSVTVVTLVSFAMSTFR